MWIKWYSHVTPSKRHWFLLQGCLWMDSVTLRCRRSLYFVSISNNMLITIILTFKIKCNYYIICLWHHCTVWVVLEWQWLSCWKWLCVGRTMSLWRWQTLRFHICSSHTWCLSSVHFLLPLDQEVEFSQHHVCLHTPKCSVAMLPTMVME